jgi:hypothetical protein
MIGYDLPYDREREIELFIGHAKQAAEAMLHMGRHLIMIKENEPYGEFIDIVQQRLGLNIRTAQKMMQAAVKFMGLSPEASASLGTHLGKTKIFVLMNEADTDLEALAEGGTLAGLTLDEIQRMTRQELESALREARADITAKDTVIAGKAATITKMQTQQAKLQPPTPDEEVAKLRRETSDYAFQTEAIIRGPLREGIEELSKPDIETGASQSEFAAGLLAQLERAIAELRSEFGVKAKPDGDPTPEWDRDQ